MPSKQAVTFWRPFYQLLTDPAADAYALAPGSPPVRVDSGPVDEVYTRAEENAADGGDLQVAVVARLRSDLVVVDVDGCASLVEERILESAELFCASLAHLAASGSPDSRHYVFAVATDAGRRHFLADLLSLREWLALPSNIFDIYTDVGERSSRRDLRLPGSVSLKGADHCRSIDATGRPLTAAAAAQRAARALGIPVPAHRTGTATRHKTPAPVQQPNPATVTALARRIPQVEDTTPRSGWILTAPYAWTHRPTLTRDDWSTLTAKPVKGYRSHAATEAAWRLYRHGIRSWAAARGWYEHCSAFIKFAGAETAGKAHWDSIVARANQHRQVTDADKVTCDSVLAALVHWDTETPDLYAALAAVIEHRFTDGGGLISRPVAVRDVATWLTVSTTTAARLRRRLQQEGVLRRTAGAGGLNFHTADQFTLVSPSATYRRSVEHVVTGGVTLSPAHALHPLWGTHPGLGQHARHLHQQLLPDEPPLPTQALARLCGLPTGTSTYGTLHLLRRMEEVGLVSRVGTGRGTHWRIGPSTLDAAAAALGVSEAVKLRRTHTSMERIKWHSRGWRARRAAERRWARWQTRLRRARHHTRGAHHADLLDELLSGYRPRDINGEASARVALRGRRSPARQRPPNGSSASA